ncbi:hypothetical protein ESCOMM127M_06015 [Escherichia coli]|jgi:hypothetical protein|uniref:Uncharacterized protein n=1 Tax=Escherichia marmotae TaxID=1499973 RepID=A0A7Z8ZNC3_9ESCH|nr:hypothetical protein EUAG_00595 [Escherichia coli O104:H4 str. C227-11]EHF27107.1 hypothetical protein EUBG_00592 [Escherichia coli O104:H4 str. C236-11]EHF37378.1 hypothetical protein EUEG_00578 [Escherichia coli O104:H4 str. 09-7901]EHF39665.1 hypothetical protein EUHG_00596 [Escherichia coli O104:H4 str. 11-4404]EHF44228.1 hypothetical protein EUFG_00593 [Escherichia coli O104:H4 str. 11-3677]EHF46007.1 hypothetical protein EUIG_00601 [Escherichia coli O104:H4 str. 11-4522]EHF49036.1 hy
MTMENKKPHALGVFLLINSVLTEGYDKTFKL